MVKLGPGISEKLRHFKNTLQEVLKSHFYEKIDAPEFPILEVKF